MSHPPAATNVGDSPSGFNQYCGRSAVQTWAVFVHRNTVPPKNLCIYRITCLLPQCKSAGNLDDPEDLRTLGGLTPSAEWKSSLRLPFQQLGLGTGLSEGAWGVVPVSMVGERSKRLASGKGQYKGPSRSLEFPLTTALVTGGERGDTQEVRNQLNGYEPEIDLTSATTRVIRPLYPPPESAQRSKWRDVRRSLLDKSPVARIVTRFHALDTFPRVEITFHAWSSVVGFLVRMGQALFCPNPSPLGLIFGQRPQIW
ncbi:hypothetical protein B0H13DRAFT_1887951 [Mycena leptocephala]|nr:hypothetical protein B0H13DRAFT_1887951 [Mycena leptocephala]